MNLCTKWLSYPLVTQSHYSTYSRHVVKPGTAEHRTVENGMPEHQIRKGKTWNTNSGTPNTGGKT